ncbi:DsrE family protein [Arthrobacter sp. AL08]|uniref:DsrE family protein n=1 Tax=Micrococcaceae TaxID=1268 RepID=UPI00249CB388|nr:MULTISPECIES: DsrE family protein [Micrococcaceae]MDI3240869.1 DsrE family protein [Arthrobacter sp. AL05]MDI3277155.1 DsrE family protein [Arthrobacter sp. AL08]MDJ0352404.1 DsrE family protein [Pseudarthrobacter sp. PH31-O2]
MSEFAADHDAGHAVDNGGGPPEERAGGGRRGLVAHAAGPLPDGALAGVLRSSQNAVAALGPEVPVEAVIQGPGVAQLAEGSAFGEAISTAVAGGVRVLACGNSLRSAGVPAERLLPGVDIVPAAIAHLAERQWDGWAYIRL